MSTRAPRPGPPDEPGRSPDHPGRAVDRGFSGDSTDSRSGGGGCAGEAGAGDAPHAAWRAEADRTRGAAWRAEIAPEEVDPAARTYWEAEADAYQAEHGAFLVDPRSGAVDSTNPMPRTDHAAAAHDASSPAVGSGLLEASFDSSSFVWGPEGLTEAEAQLLGPVAALRGRRVLEVGCGAAQCSAWLASRGVQSVGIDIAVNQLRHADRPPCAQSGDWLPQERQEATRLKRGEDEVGVWPAAASPERAGSPERAASPERAESPWRAASGSEARSTAGSGRLHLVAATATALPFVDDAFDAAFSAYGAVQFVADLDRLIGEVARVLRPGGRWAFSVTHPVRWAFPDDPGPAGLSVSGSYFDRIPYVERSVSDGRAVYAEFHRTIGDYVTALRRARFMVEQLLEPEWPDWNARTWGGWSPLRGTLLPGTLVIGCRAAARG